MQPLWSASVVGMQGGGTPIIDVLHGCAGGKSVRMQGGGTSIIDVLHGRAGGRVSGCKVVVPPS